MPRTHEPIAKDAPGLSWVHEIGEAVLWPRLLRAPALAARPQRVVLGAFILLTVGALGSVRFPWRGAEKPPFIDAMLEFKLRTLGELGRGALALDLRALAGALWRLVWGSGSLAFGDYPLETLVLGLPMLLVVAVLAGALCRSVACEFCQEITLSWTRQLAFAVARWRSLVGVLVLPWAVVWAIALLLAGAGFVCFNGVPGLELLGGLLFGVAVMLGLAAVLCTVAALLAGPMLIPAAVCEGTDAIDGAGRAIAYAFARPLRLLCYLAVGALVWSVAAAVALGVAEGAAEFAKASATAWVSERGVEEVRGPAPVAGGEEVGAEEGPGGGLAGASSRMVGFWGSCLRVLAGGYCVSVGLTVGTMVYLFMRQVCDGQHYAELWTPGEIERSFAAALGRDPSTPVASGDAGTLAGDDLDD